MTSIDFSRRAVFLAGLALSGCGARTGLREPAPSTAACNPYDRFEVLVPKTPGFSLRPMGLGGPRGEFVCYTALRTDGPGGAIVSDRYSVINRLTGSVRHLNTPHDLHPSPGDCSLSDDGNLAVVIGRDISTPFGTDHIYLHDLRSSAPAVRLTQSGSGEEANGSSQRPRILPNGREVFFLSDANNLPDGGLRGIYVYDTTSRSMNRLPISVNLNLGHSFSVSSNGQRIAFIASAVRPDGSAQSSDNQIYLFDRETGQDRLISSTPEGIRGNSTSRDPYIDGEGRRIFFSSTSSDLLPGVSGEHIYEWQEGRTLRLLSAVSGRPVSGDLNTVMGASRDGLSLLIGTNSPEFSEGPVPSNLELAMIDVPSGRRRREK